MHIVGGNEFEPEFTCKSNQLGLHLKLHLQSVVMKLHVKVVAPENFAKLLKYFARLERLFL